MLIISGTNPKKNCCQCSNLASKQSSMCSYAPPPNMNAQSVSSYEESSDTDDCEAEILEMLLLEEITSQIMMENNMLSMLPGKEAEKPQEDSLENKYSISECMKALNGSSGFTQDEKLKVADFLKGRIHHDFLPKI